MKEIPTHFNFARDVFEYLKVGVPLTLLTTLVGVAWLALTHY